MEPCSLSRCWTIVAERRGGVRREGVQFGEPARDSLARELREELKCEIFVDAAPRIFENIYKHEGAIGHEIVFAFPVTLMDGRLYERARFQMSEDGGTLHWLEWLALSRLRSGELILYPEGLIERLTVSVPPPRPSGGPPP
jgi:hypothetical protein